MSDTPFSPAWAAVFGSGWTSLSATQALQATITGLIPGVTYDIRVVALNAVGPAIFAVSASS